MRFSATLHDRNRNSTSPATVRTEPGVLFIQLENGRILDWTLGDIESARALDDGSFILQSGKKFLEVADPDFGRALERSFPKHHLFRQSFFDKIGVAGCLLSLVGILLPLLALYFFLLPFLAERAAEKISTDVEKQIGDAWFHSLTAAYKIDTAQTRLVQQFYDSLLYGGDYQMRITVVNEPVVNAFAVPGGHIVVFDSILGIMGAPEQLAGLLAHEASHVQLKHSTRAILREMASSLFFSLIFGEYGDVTAVVAQHGDQLAGLSYSRELELEADDNGLRLMLASHIPPHGMPDLFRKMKNSLEKEKTGDVPNFLNTHPSMDERLKIAEEKIEAAGDVPKETRAGLRQIWEEIRKQK